MNKEATNEAYRKAGALQMLAPFASFVVAAALTAGKKKGIFELLSLLNRYRKSSS